MPAMLLFTSWRKYIAIVVWLLLLPATQAADYQDITFNIDLSAETCTVSAPARVDLGNSGGGDFSSSRTASLRKFTVTVSDCVSGVTGTPVIEVQPGADTILLQGSDTIFARAGAGSATHVGIGLRPENFGGTPSQFYDENEMVPKAHYQGAADQSMDGTYIYTAGMVSDGLSAPTTGTVEASFIFNVAYH
ncbi:type 1 fimbrial protein [Salmonella enterica subsp. enterica]|nr:type 1 fimbrial protein [Salmonella enterica]EBM0758457.1 type 1 fimbrial protein [Salmonella enterica subsp. enterica serovar Muenchen]EBZ4665951.1 type 1 fimbrial protein [Salmonella enterica subsp. enterica serovar Bovismorbificans]ECH8729962.1 type 1 fimbrial protein [Salmonella enterica subsp. enterica]ECH8735028.1 type 1 fimbrial protein [Salmonella enterica subsp. enterica serovar Wandsworth]EGI6307234.1 type 1 fimbrial protein [Salmonella enterica subsp. enterica serovar Hindmarsh]